MTRAAVLCLCAAIAGACAEDAAPPRAPLSPRATLVLEPARLGVGDVASVELAVVTRPGDTPRPIEPPEVPGFWRLDAEALPLEKRDGHWIHRTRLRLRAREVGRFEWPGGRVEVEAADGSVSSLDYAALPLEVVSVLSEHPDRFQPYPAARPPQAVGGGSSLLAAAALGAGFALSLVGLVWLARRRRAAPPEETARPAPPSAPAWVAMRSALAAARERAETDPVGAANATAVALRRYAALRFRADSVARTTEELAAATPPFLGTSRWDALVALLRGLDAVRFPPRDPAALGAELATRLDEVEAFVEDTVPPGDRGSAA